MNSYKTTLETYNLLAQQYQDKFMDFDHYHESYDLLISYIEKSNASILEIACGPGNISSYLLQKNPNYNIFGIDGAPNMIDLARINNPLAEYEVMDCRDIWTIGRKFDVVICGFGLPYLSQHDAGKMIADAKILLKSSGIIYLSTMEGDYSNSGYKGSNSHDLEVYVYYHNEQFLVNSLNKNGFNIKDISRKNYTENDGSKTVDLFIIANQ